MSGGVVWAGRLRWLGLAAALVVGCAKSGNVAPSEAPARESAPSAVDAWADNEGDDLARLERALLAEEGRLRAAGVAALGGEQAGGDAEPPMSAPTSAPVAPPEQKVEATRERPDTRGDRCARICALRGSICGLKAQICGLRDRHGDDPRYEELCGRATADCRAASEACDGCA